jgi:predicted MFS family arabinose efflux permease
MSLAPESEQPPVTLPAGAPSTARILMTVQVAVFATSLSVRAADPVIPKIAADFAMDAGTVALLSTAFALPYAIVQPVMGAIADMMGKTRVMTISLVVIVISGFLAAMAPSFSVLLAARVMAGIVTGGVFPVALAIAGDLVPVNRRQIVIGRLLGAAMLGNLLGSPCSGFVGDLIGWRGVFHVVACLAVLALAGAVLGFRSLITAPRKQVGLAAIAGHYRTIFRNPLAKICFSAVLLEGAFLFGIFPYVASLLAAAGETRAAIAGLVIAAFGLGGIAYTVTVPVLLRRLGEIGMMRGGGLLAGTALMVVAAELPWQAQMVAFALLGYGFYSLHGVIQIYATELAPAGRGTATALHSSFYFLGQALGPIVYRYGLASVGLVATAAFSASVVVAVGFVCSAYLRRPRREGGPTSS